MISYGICLSLTSLSLIISKLIHVATNGIILFFLWLSNTVARGHPWWLSGKESACQHRSCRFDPWARKSPWRRNWQTSPGFLPRKSHGQRSLVCYSPWGHKESDMTERLNNNCIPLYISTTSLSIIYHWIFRLFPCLGYCD